MEKRILYVTYGNPLTEIGGIESYLLTLIKNLKAKLNNSIKISVAYPVFLNNQNNTVKDERLFTPVELFLPLPKSNKLLPFAKFLFNLYLVFFIIRHNKEYDILHVHGDNGTFALRYFKGKKIFSLHGNSRRYYSVIKDQLKGIRSLTLFLATLFSGFVEKIGVLSADLIFSDQVEVISYFTAFIKHNNIVYLPNFVDTKFFNPAENRINIRKKLGIDENKLYAVWVGTTILRKRLDLAVKSVTESKNFNLLVIGPKEYSHKKILNFGFIKKKELLLEIYRASEVILITSIHEGQSIAMLEAMSVGCVPIIRRYLLVPGFVDGENCFLADSDDSFRQILLNLENKISDLEIMSKNIRKLAVDMFSVDKVISRLVEYYGINPPV